MPIEKVSKRTTMWTFIAASVAAFMVSLDNLVVTTALPSIRRELGASLQTLEWTVNAYTLSFGVLLLTGAALGERFGRRRILAIGLTVFTMASAAAALAPSAGWLVAARAVQGVGGALILPLTLTMLSAAVSPAKRGAALAAWGAASGLAVALGPLVGGAVVQGFSWQWIFWLNVPIGVLLVPIVATRLTPGRGGTASLDLPGLGLVSAGLFGIVLGLIRGNVDGWTSGTVLASLISGVVLVIAFLVWQTRAKTPMLPLSIFRSRGFSATNIVALLMSFGMFGSVFLLAQFLQTVQGYSPLSAGLHTLPWTGMPVLVAPLAGWLSDRFGGRPLLIVGLALQASGLAWLAAILQPTTPYADIVPAFIMSGVGMALFFVPIANVVLGSVPRQMEGIASGANNAIREIGGVFGVAVLAAVFSARGGYTSVQAFNHGLIPALWVGAGVVAAGALAAFIIPRRRSALVDAPIDEMQLQPAIA